MGRKDEIIDTAAKLFKNKGYKAVGMRMLAEEIGIKAGSLYYHIESKQEILSIVVLGLAHRFVDHMAMVIKDNRPAVVQLEQIISFHIELTLEDPNKIESLQNNWMYLEGDNLKRYKKLRKVYEEDMRQIYKKGIREGHIKDVNPEIMIYSLLATLRSLYLWYPRQENLDPRRLKEDMIKILLEGMLRRG